MKTLTVTEALRNFSDLIGYVRFAGKSVTLTKGNKPVVRIEPVKRMSTVADLRAWATDPNRARLTPEEAEAFERDIEAGRKHANTPPVNKWDIY